MESIGNKDKEIHILLFYKYVDVDSGKVEKLREKHLKFCKELGVLGKVFISHEGINGSVSGSKEQVEKYKDYVHSISEFNDVIFKEDIGIEHPFTKMIVKSRDEVVSLKVDVDLKNTGKHIEPKELMKFYESGSIGKDVIILDARNDYEYKVGKFKDAIQLNIKTFRQFPEALKNISDFKDKKVVMYCTGGIRCEKASALLKENGFNDVSQLSGGIVTFGKEFPDSVWEGKCFVFDKRLVVPINTKDQTPISDCTTCGKQSDLYRNCRSNECDKLFIQCVECQRGMNGCCSVNCLEDFKIQCQEKSLRNQNRRVNKSNIVNNNQLN